MINNWTQELVKRAGELFARSSKALAVEDAEGDRPSALQDRRLQVDFLALSPPSPSAVRRAMIAPEAGLCVSRQCARISRRTRRSEICAATSAIRRSW
jgi:hypothetical protein